MMTFKEFMGSQEVQTQPQEVQPQQGTSGESTKWKATKEEILRYWKNLRPDMPVQMRPIDYEHKGSTYDQDGLRITGSPQFIGSILARLKEILSLESPTSNLSVIYRQTQSPSKMAMGQNKISYVFYVSTRNRGRN